MRRLVVTADDFGLAPEVNEAVEIAHRDGILSAASLMVAGASAADAAERARRLPRLRVGLHVVLVEGTPALPAEGVPDLVDSSGQFRTDMAKLGFDIFAKPSARRQLEAEVEAQFQAFAATGLTLDHVNAHKHFHLHPTIARTIVAAGRRHGVRGLRVPIEPRAVLVDAEPWTPAGRAWVTTPWARLLARNARRAGLQTPDAVFGLAWSGAMTPSRVEALLRRLPPGRTEIYLHPAMRGGFAGQAPGYRYSEELSALTSPAVIAAARQPDIALGGYADF